MCGVFFFEGGWKIFTDAFGQGQIRPLTMKAG